MSDLRYGGLAGQVILDFIHPRTLLRAIPIALVLVPFSLTIFIFKLFSLNTL